jgi:hypothetical protein
VTKPSAYWLFPPILTLFMAGCSFQQTGPEQHDSQTIDRDGSESVKVNVDLGAGELKVAGGTDKLAAADFRYGGSAGKPEVHYSSIAGHGSLTIKQPSGSSINHATIAWDVRLNQEVPLEVQVHLGAGEARLNLGALNLRHVDVQIGAGELDLDLRGTPKASYDVQVQGGAGEATIHLPSSVGVDAQVSGGIGEISAPGLRKDGSRYVNDALGKSPITIRLNVEGGVGEIKLISN